MATTTFSKHFDYYKPGEKMFSYEPGDHENVPETHLKVATEAGAIAGAKPAAATTDGKAK